MTDGTPREAPEVRARGKYAPVRLPESEILRRGLDTFAELGYAATTMRELARRLGVSHNFIHERYGSKDDFWRAVVDFGLHDGQPRSTGFLPTATTPRNACEPSSSTCTGLPRTTPP